MAGRNPFSGSGGHPVPGSKKCYVAPMSWLLMFPPLALLAGAVAVEMFRRASMWRRVVAAALATLAVTLWLTARPLAASSSLLALAALYVGFVAGTLWEPLRRH